MIQFNRYPGGKRNILTMSYDDGMIYDRKLIEVFNKYGIRGSFHLNSGLLTDDRHIDENEIKKLYQGHEVSCHSLTHPSLTQVLPATAVNEILSDRKNLEELCGYAVRGMSWPNGAYNEDTISAAKNCGIVYSRTVLSTKKFTLPQNFLAWHPTCHHKDCLEMADLFLKSLAPWRSYLFYVWGHSYEFNNDNNWDLIEEFCKKMSNLEDVWYATNIEIYDYITAVKNLQVTVDEKKIYNPNVADVWISYQNETIKIPGGQQMILD